MECAGMLCDLSLELLQNEKLKDPMKLRTEEMNVG
jgi:hypothetical protein